MKVLEGGGSFEPLFGARTLCVEATFRTPEPSEKLAERVHVACAGPGKRMVCGYVETPTIVFVYKTKTFVNTDETAEVVMQRIRPLSPMIATCGEIEHDEAVEIWRMLKEARGGKP